MTLAHLIVTLLPGLALVASDAIAQQTGSLRGRVIDDEGGGLISASVQIEGTTLGARTSAAGSFSIARVPAGEVWVTARLLGYEEARQRVTIRAEETTTITLQLTSGSVGLREVEVRSTKRQDQSDTRASVTKIEPREAKYLPGAAEDVLRSLRALPGVLSPNDFSSQLVVRGSGPDQNLIVLDDIEIFNPYRLYGLISMFNPETVADITLLTAGFPANYGDRLSAVLDVTNREGERDEAIRGKLNASVTNANLVLEGALPAGLKGGWLLSARRTYYDLIAAPILRSLNVVEGDVALPNFTDLQFKALMRPSPEHSIVVNALLNRDGTELRSAADRDRLDSINVVDESFNWVGGLSWRYAPNERFLTKTIASWYENLGETEFGGAGGAALFYGDISRDSLMRILRALPPAFKDSLRSRGIDPDNPPQFGIDDGKASFNFRKYSIANRTSARLGDHLIEAGAGLDLIRTQLAFSSKPDSLLTAFSRAGRGSSAFLDSIDAVADFPRAHAYVQDRIGITDDLFVQLGARVDYYGMLDRLYVSPRASFSWAPDPITTVRGAWGVYYQSPGYEKLIDGQTFFDLTSPEVRTLKAENAKHYVLGADRMLDEEWQVKIEGYYKDFDDLIIQQRVPGTRYATTQVEGRDRRYPGGWTRPVGEPRDSVTTIPVNGAEGEAYGFEVMLQKIGASGDSKLSGWLSYALAWANRKREGVTFPFNFDQRHTVNLVLSYRANDWLELGASFRFGSGYPFTPALGYEPIVITRTDSTGESPVIATNIFGEAIFRVDRGGIENIGSGRLPAYHRLDLRATVYADWWDLDWAFYLDLVNAYNRSNVLSRSYRVDRGRIELVSRDVYMLPILPTLGFSVSF